MIICTPRPRLLLSGRSGFAHDQTAGICCGAWKSAARSRQRVAPRIGFVSTQSADDDFKNLTVLVVQGVKETGFVEDQNVTVEFR
jgi:hypothetical protein